MLYPWCGIVSRKVRKVPIKYYCSTIRHNLGLCAYFIVDFVVEIGVPGSCGRV